MRTVKDLRAAADGWLFSGDYRRALYAYTAWVRLQPTALDARLRVADALLATGDVQRAAVVYAALARHAAYAGYPLRALVSLKVLQKLEPALGSLLDDLAGLYGVNSARLGRATRLSLALPDESLPDGFSLPDGEPPEELPAVAQQIAADTSAIAAYPTELPPIPLFSELPAEAFAAVLNALKLIRARPGDALISEGSLGSSFFVLARGSVTVCRRTASGDEMLLATLHDGSIFGEMALVSATPRSATVRAATDCDLLEFDREALGAAAGEVSIIARALEKFTRERLLNNLLASAPLFRPLDRKQRFDLIRRFSAHDVAAGTDVIKEGIQGRGLYVLLSGEVDVWKRDGEEKVLLASLKPGDVFGEISLITEQPTTATVTAAINSTVLFLSREYFQRLVEAIADIRAYVEGLSEERLMDTRILMSGTDESTVELTDDDLIMV